jgi:imidazolonepropionase-like amidohydrolase
MQLNWTSTNCRRESMKPRKQARRQQNMRIGATSIKNTVRAGINSVEHASFMDQETVELIRSSGVYVVPTFSIYHKMVKSGVEKALPNKLLI